MPAEYAASRGQQTKDGSGPTADAPDGIHTFSHTAGTEPTPEVQGDRVLIGRQSVTLRERNLVLGQMAGP